MPQARCWSISAGCRSARVARVEHRRGLGQYRPLLVRAPVLPRAQRREATRQRGGRQPAEHNVPAAAHVGWFPACDNAALAPAGRRPTRPVTDVNDSLKTLLVIGFLVLIVWNLGAGLYYMLTDRGESKRTVNALTRRIAWSVALILLVALAIWAGWIEPHGVGG